MEEVFVSTIEAEERSGHEIPAVVSRTAAMAARKASHPAGPRSLIMALAVPVLMLVLFGYALTSTWIASRRDLRQMAAPRAGADLRFAGSRYFQIVASSRSTAPSRE